MTLTEAQRRGVRLLAARKLKRLSQADAAEKIGVSRVTLSGWENGEAIDEQWVPAIVATYGGSKGWVRYGEGIAPAGYNVVEAPASAKKPRRDLGLPKEEADRERPVVRTTSRTTSRRKRSAE